jgi:glycosyltransferase involved in cell wall biosynthesis
MHLLVLQPRLSYYSGGGEFMPMEAIIELLKNTEIKKITLITTQPINNQYTTKYLEFKKMTKSYLNFNLIELIIPIKYRNIYEINPGTDRSRWDLESLMFIRMIHQNEIDFRLFTHSISFYILDGLSLPCNLINIIYLLGYPSEANTLRPGLLSSYDKIFANSISVVNNWQKDMTKIQYQNTKVLVQGINFQNLNLEELHYFDNDFKNIIFYGRLIERKGILDLIDAVNLLVKKGVKIKLHIFGDGELFDTIKSRIKDYNLTNNVIYHGFKSDVLNYLPNADLCCFPSHEKEGLMSSVLEAMFYNGVVITTLNNGSETVIKNLISGFLIPPRDVSKLSETILKVLNLEKEKLNKIKLYAKSSIERNAKWESFSKRFIDLLK